MVSVKMFFFVFGESRGGDHADTNAETERRTISMRPNIVVIENRYGTAVDNQNKRSKERIEWNRYLRF